MSSPVQQLPAATDYTTQVFGEQPQATGGASMGWIGPAIMGVSSLLGGWLGGRGQSQAADAQLTASREAIEFQKAQQEAERRRLAAMWTQWYNGRRALMSMYGLDVPTAENPFMVEGAGVRGAAPRGTSLADLVNRGKPISDEWGMGGPEPV